MVACEPPYMKNKKLLMSLAAAFAVAGCANTPSEQSDEKPPDKANRVEVLMYDNTPRPKTARLDVYELEPPQRPYKVIALLTCEGAVDQEVVMTKAIFYRARQIGAEGVMSAGTISTQQGDALIIGRGWGFGGGGSTRCVFRARAIVYEDK